MAQKSLFPFICIFTRFAGGYGPKVTIWGGLWPKGHYLEGAMAQKSLFGYGPKVTIWKELGAMAQKSLFVGSVAVPSELGPAPPIGGFRKENEGNQSWETYSGSRLTPAGGRGKAPRQSSSCPHGSLSTHCRILLLLAPSRALAAPSRGGSTSYHSLSYPLHYTLRYTLYYAVQPTLYHTL